jgi:hypothetical protein
VLIVTCQINVQVIAQLYCTDGILLSKITRLRFEIGKVLVTALAGGEPGSETAAHNAHKEDSIYHILGNHNF